MFSYNYRKDLHMKFFHLSDLHIGLKLINRDLRKHQEYILNQVIRIAEREKPDAILIAGDIYDKAIPSAEAVEVFNHFITDLTMVLPKATIMMVSGNHDSGPRIDCFRDVLSRQNLYMIGMPPQTEEALIEKIVLHDNYGSVCFYLLPFVKPSMVKQVVGTDENGNPFSYNETIHKLIEREHIDSSERNVLVSHQFYLPVGKNPDEIERMDSEIKTIGNIDEVSADILEKFDYTALGHIHKPMKVGSEYFRYCGTPLACSISEAGQQKGIIMVEMGKKGEEIKLSVLPLTPLRQVRIIQGELNEVLKQACNDYVTIILTDQIDFDVIDMPEQLRAAFPYLLEIKRNYIRRSDYTRKLDIQAELDPFELCCEFLNDLDDREKEILKDVINTVQEVR